MFIKSIQLIGNLSNKSHYSYTSEQVSQMMSALDKEIRLADKCNIWADCSIDLEKIKTIKSGDKIFVEKCQ